MSIVEIDIAIHGRREDVFSAFEVRHKFRRIDFVKACLVRRPHTSGGKGPSILLGRMDQLWLNLGSDRS